MARKKTAGAFDIRNIIGLLVGIYGLLLVIAGIFLDPGTNPDTQLQKSSGDNIWVGIALIVTAVIFFAWTKMKPIVVDESQIPASKPRVK